MSERSTVPCRVYFRAFHGQPSPRRLVASNTSGPLAVPSWPLFRRHQIRCSNCGSSSLMANGRVLSDWAHITWGHWDSFTVECVSLPTQDQARLKIYLDTDQLVPSCGVPSSGNAQVA